MMSLRSVSRTRHMRFNARLRLALTGISGRFCLITETLIVLASALVSLRVCLCDVFARILLLQIFQSAVHLCRYLVELLATHSGVKCVFESEAIEFFIVAEFPP